MTLATPETASLHRINLDHVVARMDRGELLILMDASFNETGIKIGAHCDEEAWSQLVYCCDGCYRARWANSMLMMDYPRTQLLYCTDCQEQLYTYATNPKRRTRRR